jgi:MFS family permease
MVMGWSRRSGQQERPEAAASNGALPGVVTDARPSSAYTIYILVVLAMVALLQNVDRQIMSILLVPIKAELHVSDTAMGLLTGFVFSAVYISAGIPLAYLCDRSNRARILTISVAFWSVCTALCGATASYVQLALARFGVALGEAGGNPACISIIGDLFPPSRRAAAMGGYYLGASGGIFVGMWLGGVVNQAMGWRAAFVSAGLPGFIIVLVLWLTVTEPIRGASDNMGDVHGNPSFQEAQRYLWKLPTYKWLVLGNACHSLVLYGTFAWVPAFLIRVHLMNTGYVGFWTGMLTGLGTGIGNFLLGRIADHMGRRQVGWYMRLAGLTNFMALPFMAIFLMFTPHAVVFVSYLVTVGLIGSAAAPIASVTQAIVRPNMRSMSFSTQYMVTSLIGMGGGPLLIGMLNDALTPHFGTHAIRYSLLILDAPLSLVCATAFILASRTMEADIAQAHLLTGPALTSLHASKA